MAILLSFLEDWEMCADGSEDYWVRVEWLRVRNAGSWKLTVCLTVHLNMRALINKIVLPLKYILMRCTGIRYSVLVM
jgi:hypothetical protein